MDISAVANKLFNYFVALDIPIKNERLLLGTFVYIDKLAGQLTSTQEF